MPLVVSLVAMTTCLVKGDEPYGWIAAVCGWTTAAILNGELERK